MTTLPHPGPPVEASLPAGLLRKAVFTLSPAYFAMVMATGIVSVASHALGSERIALTLFGLNIAAYLVILSLSILRAIWYWPRLVADLIDHQRGPGFFTFVAGTCVLASQFLVIAQDFRVGVVLWSLGIGSWIVLTYTILAAFTVKEEKPSLYQGINGAWLLAVVATQAVALVSALISNHFSQPERLIINFFALSMWLWGGMLYIWMISLIFYRYTFFRLAPGDLTPPYWINMGAMAISALAGALLIENAPHAPFLLSILPFLKGFTVFYWATGTWWIPMLVILALWRHVYKRFPLAYDPLYWGAVFPLGMYTACTFELARALDFPFLMDGPHIFLAVALAAWTATFLGLLHTSARLLQEHFRGHAVVDH